MRRIKQAVAGVMLVAASGGAAFAACHGWQAPSGGYGTGGRTGGYSPASSPSYAPGYSGSFTYAPTTIGRQFQLNMVTTATGNTNSISGSAGPITVTQTSQAVIAHGGYDDGGTSLTPTIAQAPSSSNPSSSRAGGGGRTLDGNTVLPVTTSGTVLGGASAPVASGNSIPVSVGLDRTGDVMTAPVQPGAASTTLGATASNIQGVVSAPVRSPVAGVASPVTGASTTGATTGNGVGLQLCTSCLTGGVGG